VVVRCHGHLTISTVIEKELAQRFGVYRWDRSIADKRRPLRAIIKDLVHDESALNERILGKMRRDLLKMRKLGVHPQDMRWRNYRDGLLLDFSIAITKPHWFFQVSEPWLIRAMEK